MAWAEEEDGDAAEVCRLVRTCGRTDRQTDPSDGYLSFFGLVVVAGKGNSGWNTALVNESKRCLFYWLFNSSAISIPHAFQGVTFFQICCGLYTFYLDEMAILECFLSNLDKNWIKQTTGGWTCVTILKANWIKPLLGEFVTMIKAAVLNPPKNLWKKGCISHAG